MAYATSTIIAIAATVAAAATTGYAAYAASENAQDEADANRKAAQQQAEAEAQAGEARRQQVLNQYTRLRDSQRSRAAAAGVGLESSSLLEGQMEAASLAEYDARLAAYPHILASQAADYRSKIFNWQKQRLSSSEAGQIGLSAGRSIASNYAANPDLFKGMNSGRGPGYGSIDPRDAGEGLPY